MGLASICLPGVALGLDRATVLISAPTGRDAGFASGSPPYQFFDISDDGKRVAIETYEQLVPADTDASWDVYERFGGVTRLASAPQPGAPNPTGGSYNPIVAGDRIYFSSSAGLVPEDTDAGSLDVYEFSGGVTRLVSKPAPGATGFESIGLVGASPGGMAAYSESPDHVTSEDGDCVGVYRCVDVFEHSGGTTKLVSAPGPGAMGPSWTAQYSASSEDGSRVFFNTKESLTSDDADAPCPPPPPPGDPASQGCMDIYERSGGQTRLVSAPEGGPTVLATDDVGPWGGGMSDDGTHVFFASEDHLAPGDGDGVDVFERFNGHTILVSVAAPGGSSGSGHSGGARSSADGSRVFFGSDDPLVPEDDDGGYADVYERSGGVTRLISTGPASMTGEGFAFMYGLSADGSRVFFESNERLTEDDFNSDDDLYERTAGVTSLASGPTSAGPPAQFKDISYQGNSQDGLRAFFETSRRLDPADTDGDYDIYEHAEGTTTLMSAQGPGASGSSADMQRVYQAVSDIGDRVFWITSERLVGEDTDDRPDVYAAIPASEVPSPPAGGGGGSGGVAGAVDTNARNVHVHKVVVPKSRQKLAALGVRVLANCDEDCRIVLEVRVSQRIANAMGLTGTLLARGSVLADAGERRWVLAKPTGAARRALRSYQGGGRLQVNVTGVALP